MTNDIARYCVWNFLRAWHATWCGRLLGQFHAPNTVELRIAIFPIPHSVNSRSEKHYFSRYTFEVPLLPCWITENYERVWNLMIFNHQRLEQRAAIRVRWNDKMIKINIDNLPLNEWFSAALAVRSAKIMLFQTTSVHPNGKFRAFNQMRALNFKANFSTWAWRIHSIVGCQRAI